MKNLRITVDGKVFDVNVEILDDQSSCCASRPAAAPASVASAAVAAPAAPAPAAAAPAAAVAGDVPSPLSGKVVSLDKKVGDVVKAGDQLLTLEAMKMNTLVYSPADGTITEFKVNVGDGVQEGQALCSLA